MSKPRSKKNRESEYSTKWLEILDTVTNIIIIPILVLSVICSIVMINSKRSNNVPNLFGYSLVTILSGSMTNSGFNEDDTVIVKSIDTKEIEVGDVFKYNNAVYLKIDLDSRDGVNVFNFSEGELDYFREDRLVQAVNGTLTIEPW